jgi:hypothetical protein
VPIYPPGSVIPVCTSLKDLPDEEDEYGRSYKKRKAKIAISESGNCERNVELEPK